MIRRPTQYVFTVRYSRLVWTPWYITTGTDTGHYFRHHTTTEIMLFLSALKWLQHFTFRTALLLTSMDILDEFHISQARSSLIA